MTLTDLLRGRKVELYLQNKSGGAVAAGDVVVLSDNDEAFTTTTTGQAEVSIGVAQEAIANDAYGRVLIHGYAALVNVPASVTRLHYLETHTVAKQATGNATRRAGSAGQFLTGGTSPSALLWGVTDQTAAGGGLDEGTSFPVGPTTDDRFKRTDIEGGVVFAYDGTRWVSEQMFTLPLAQRLLVESASADPTRIAQTPIHGTHDIYAVRLDVAWYVSTPNTGAAYWTLDLKNVAESTTHATVDSSALSGSTWGKVSWTTGGVIPASDVGLMVMMSKTGSPGNSAIGITLYYRLIAT